MNISTELIDYLQRAGINPCKGVVTSPSTSAPPELRRLLRVRGISSQQKGQPRQDERSTNVPTENLLIGLSGYQIPVAFVLEGHPAGLGVQVGVWSQLERENAPAQKLEQRKEMLDATLRGLYPGVDTVDIAIATKQWSMGGIGLGVPTLARPDSLDGSSGIDRLARAMTGKQWSVVVLAEPVDEALLLRLRHELNREMRSVAAGEQASGAQSPLGKSYTKLLQGLLADLTRGQSVGAWRTSVYLLGDETSYPVLAGNWRAIFSGPRSLPEPVRVFQSEAAVKLAERWAMPDIRGSQGPGDYRHPYECQTLLTSSQLCSFIQLPRLELPGFSVNVASTFDVMPPPAHAGEVISVGKVMHSSRETELEYRVTTKSLTEHAFVAGMTGSGKTNTIFHLLTDLPERVKFLVLEPAKAEYRALLAHPKLAEDRLRIFTPGNETVAPFRFNPFEVPSGIAVSEHLNLLRAAFGASFGMWTPLPEVLKRSLEEVYADRGWDLRTKDNVRLPKGVISSAAFPTLADLVAKVREVAPLLGYEEKVTADIRAALTTRLDSLRSGGMGAMLDVERSVPMEELLGHSTILELEHMGNDDDKAFLMALLLIRLVEHRRVGGQSRELRHLLVIEEAHRLLANVAPKASEETGNPRGQAVEQFTNLLSEIRAYGQGVLIADQIPVRLAPDVIKNTNLKIAHRIVAADDRQALAGAMHMNDTQSRFLNDLNPGYAAVFSKDADAPVLARVKSVKDKLPKTLPDHATVAANMARWWAKPEITPLYYPRPFCSETCAGHPRECETARHLIDDEYIQGTFARIVLSTIEERGALDRMWEELVAAVRARRPPAMDESILMCALVGHAAGWYASRRGSQNAWSYAATDEFSAKLRRIFLAKVTRLRDNKGDLQAFQTYARRLHQREYPPYSACELVCQQDPPLCLYRFAVADLVASKQFAANWEQANVQDAASSGQCWSESWQVCVDAGEQLIEYPYEDVPANVREGISASAKRVCLCFAQQMLAQDNLNVPRAAQKIFNRVFMAVIPEEHTMSHDAHETGSPGVETNCVPATEGTVLVGHNTVGNNE